MKNKSINLSLVASLLPHLFCCVIPTALFILGLAAPGAARMHIIPHYLEPWLFVFSAVMLGLSWHLILRDCRCECDSCNKTRNYRTQKIILICATVVFVLNLILHLTMCSYQD
jgi:hypothetical protein